MVACLPSIESLTTREKQKKDGDQIDIEDNCSVVCGGNQMLGCHLGSLSYKRNLKAANKTELYVQPTAEVAKGGDCAENTVDEWIKP